MSLKNQLHEWLPTLDGSVAGLCNILEQELKNMVNDDAHSLIVGIGCNDGNHFIYGKEFQRMSELLIELQALYSAIVELTGNKDV